MFQVGPMRPFFLPALIGLPRCVGGERAVSGGEDRHKSGEWGLWWQPLRATGEGSSLGWNSRDWRVSPSCCEEPSCIGTAISLPGFLWVSTLLNTDQTPTWYFRSLGRMSLINSFLKSLHSYWAARGSWGEQGSQASCWERQMQGRLRPRGLWQRLWRATEQPGGGRWCEGRYRLYKLCREHGQSEPVGWAAHGCSQPLMLFPGLGLCCPNWACIQNLLGVCWDPSLI